MKLDPKKTAMLTLDLQKGVIAMAGGYETVIATASQLTEFARKQGYLLIHVGLGFSEGHPEIADVESPFRMIKDKGLFVKGSDSAAFHESIIKPGDLTIYKHRISGFAENELQITLRSRGIENLVLFGIATSGIVLSTVTRAFDLDYRITVIEDACFDTDPEVHRVLTEKIYAKRGTVLTAKQFIEEQS